MADLQLIEELAQAALDDNKDKLPGWTFGWNNRKSSVGLCVYSKKQIQLSHPWTEVVEDDEAVQTIFHEIAHAIAITVYGHYYHGPRWKQCCIELGIEPIVASQTNKVREDLLTTPKWIFRCTGCADETYYFRKPKHHPSRYKCTRCSKESIEHRLDLERVR